LLAALGLLILTGVISLIGPKRALAAIGFTPVRDVDNPGRQPFSLLVELGGGSPNPQQIALPNNGKRLVITYVDSRSFADNPEAIEIQSTVNGVSSRLILPFTIFKGETILFSQPVMGFADPGTILRVLHTNGGNDFAQVNIHGYYNDVP